MRRSGLLLALVASTAAHDAWSARLVEKDVNLDSREVVSASHSLDTRHIPVGSNRIGKITLKSRHIERGDDDDDDDDEDDYFNRGYDHDYRKWKEDHDQLESNREEDDDDDDDNDRSHVGQIVGGVIGGFCALLLILTVWYCVRIRPKRKQRLMEEAKRQVELEKGFGASSPSIRPPPQASTVSPSDSPSTIQQRAQYVPTPFPRHAPSPSLQTGSTISGLVLPTPALTYSPSISTATAATPNLPPSHPHDFPGDKPPAYAAVLALQSSEPQPEASAYQMGQVPVPAEPPVYQLPSASHPAAKDMDGRPLARY